jgi:predicted metal-binding membrane protein
MMNTTSVDRTACRAPANATRTAMHTEKARRVVFGGGISPWFAAMATLLLAASTVATVAWCRSMSVMDDMPMPGGWTMSMMWMPVAGQGWLGAATSFTAMWTVMMIAMMLPSLIPVLWRYRQCIGQADGAHADARAALAGLGYFFVWMVFGAAAFPVMAALAAMAMRIQAAARMVPLAAGATVLLAGLLQFSGWKVRGLACCRAMPLCERALRTEAGASWRDGLRHGLHCVCCCAGLTVAWLAIGVMDLRAMVLVTVAISAERLAPARVPMAQAIGVIATALGLLLVARAAALA